MAPTGVFEVPSSVEAITPLVGQILVEAEARYDRRELTELYLFYNRSKSGAAFVPVRERLLPLDDEWYRTRAAVPWPTKMLPEVIGAGTTTLRALVREYLFVSLFRASAESLASENASRLAAMTRAEKNIGESLESLQGSVPSRAPKWDRRGALRRRLGLRSAVKDLKIRRRLVK